MASTEVQQSESSEKVSEIDTAPSENIIPEDTKNKKGNKKRARPNKSKTKNGKPISLRIHLDLNLLEPLKLPKKLRRIIKKQKAQQAAAAKCSSKLLDEIEEENPSPQKVEELSQKLEDANLKEISKQ